MKISSQIKKLREKTKMSIVDCATAIGVSQSTYRDWENGRSINGEPYIQIAALFRVSLSELFGLKENDLAIELKKLEGTLLEASEHIKNIRSNL